VAITRDPQPTTTPGDAAAKPLRARLARPVPLAVLAAFVVVGGFIAFQRIGTRANVDSVEFTRNLRGGFMAIGMTEDQPGFLLLSALDRKNVTIVADRYTNLLAGTHTRLRVTTAGATWTRRLRDPVVITIDDAGRIQAETVDWTSYTFQTLAKIGDCGRHAPPIEKHCGAPFLDLEAHIAGWPPATIPRHLRAFLAIPTDTRGATDRFSGENLPAVTEEHLASDQK